MNQVVHIFRKDCRRLWRVIGAVLLLTFLHGYGVMIDLGGGGGYSIGLSPYMLLYALAGLSVLLLPITLFLLVVSVIQEESLVGSDKFWLTRPYSRLSLFLEKLLFVVLWAVVPMLVHDVILIQHFGFPLSSAVGLLLWKGTQFAFFLLFAAALAVLSASFGRGLLLGIGAVVITLFSFYVALQSAHGAPNPDGATYGILAVLAVGAVGAFAVVAFQYRYRITPVAALLGVTTIFACVLLARFWPDSLSARWFNRNDPHLLQSVQIHPDANLKGLAPPRPAQDAAAQSRTVYYPFQADGLSDSVGFDLGVSAEFASPGPKPAPLTWGSQVHFQPQAAGSPRFADAWGPEQLIPFQLLSAGDFERVKDTEGTVSGTLFLEGYQSFAVSMPVPLPGQPHDFAIASQRCRVQSYRRDHSVALVFDCAELEPGNIARFQVRLLQDKRLIMPSQTYGDTSTAGSWPAFLSPIVRNNYRCEFPLPESAAAASAEVLVFAERHLGRAQRDFRIEHFRPAESNLQAWEERGAVRPAQ
jgi:hypothetical protein